MDNVPKSFEQTSIIDVEQDPFVVKHLRTDQWIDNVKSLPRYKGMFDQQGWFRDYVGKSQQFIPGETKEEFEWRKKDPKQLEQLKKHGWLDQEVWYHLDKNGFRTDNTVKDYNDYKGGKNVIWTGCSNSFGIGVNVEQTYSYMLHKRLHSDSNYVNLSVSGKGIETFYRFLMYWIPILRPTHVYMQHLWISSRTDIWHPIWKEFNSAKIITPPAEVIIDKENKLENINDRDSPTPWFIANKHYPDYVPHKNWERSLDFTVKSLYDPQPSLYRFISTLDALKHLFWKYKVKGYIFPSFIDFTMGSFTYVDYARDLSHPGVTTHTNWVDHYNMIIDDYNDCDLYGTSEVWRD